MSPRRGELRGMDVAAGIGAGLGLDMTGVRRLVTGALNSLGAVASDVVTEFRQLTRGSTPRTRAEDEDPRLTSCPSASLRAGERLVAAASVGRSRSGLRTALYNRRNAHRRGESA